MSQQDLMTLAPMPRLCAGAAGWKVFTTGPVTFARAPGRLDVMGGIADYTGSLVCEMPLAVAAGVAIQPRRDGQVFCMSRQGATEAAVPIASILKLSTTLREAFTGDNKWLRYPVGCVWWLLNNTNARFDGLSIMIDSDVPLGGGVSSSAAIEVATMSALAAIAGVKMDPLSLAVACQAVENHFVGAPCGVMDQVTSCMGVEGAMLEILCQPRHGAQSPPDPPAQVLGPVYVPKGYAFLGIHSGVSHEVSGDPYTDTRVAAFMGQKILAGQFPQHVRDVFLANVDRAAYHRELRPTLPEEMTGEAFTKRYGQTNDPVTTVRPGTSYRVRAAADHHVLEMGRVGRFVECIKSAATAPSRDTLDEAGSLMHESHQSYSQCANLGHPMTDLIVELSKKLGPDRGVYGAKITGGGGGGTVALLIRDDSDTRRLIGQLRQDYTHQTGRPTLFFDGTGPGAAALGTVTLPYEALK